MIVESAAERARRVGRRIRLESTGRKKGLKSSRDPNDDEGTDRNGEGGGEPAMLSPDLRYDYLGGREKRRAKTINGKEKRMCMMATCRRQQCIPGQACETLLLHVVATWFVLFLQYEHVSCEAEAETFHGRRTRTVTSISFAKWGDKTPSAPSKEPLSARKASRTRSSRRAISMMLAIRLISSCFAKWKTNCVSLR